MGIMDFNDDGIIDAFEQAAEYMFLENELFDEEDNSDNFDSDFDNDF